VIAARFGTRCAGLIATRVVAAIAGDVEHDKAGRDLAQENDASGQDLGMQ